MVDKLCVQWYFEQNLNGMHCDIPIAYLINSINKSIRVHGINNVNDSVEIFEIP